jgi:hypothetical protein
MSKVLILELITPSAMMIEIKDQGGKITFCLSRFVVAGRS